MFERLELLTPLGWESTILSVGAKMQAAGYVDLIKKLELVPRQLEYAIWYTHCGIQVLIALAEPGEALNTGHWEKIALTIRSALTASKPDLVVYNLRDAAALHFAAHHWKGPSIAFLTEASFFEPEQLSGSEEKEQLKKNIAGAKRVIVASQFLRDKFKALWGHTAEVFLNTVNVERYSFTKSTPGAALTMFQPYPNKGIDVFLAIAAERPGDRFLVVGGMGPDYRARKARFTALANLEHRIFSRDVRSAYEASRVVLVPSLAEEGFARVIIEACASGTPVIASDIGGTREAGRDAILYAPAVSITGPWHAQIDQLCDPGVYSEWSHKAALHAQSYQMRLAGEMPRLSEYLHSCISGR